VFATSFDVAQGEDEPAHERDEKPADALSPQQESSLMVKIPTGTFRMGSTFEEN